LPGKTPAQVLAMIGQHTTKALSGTVEQTSEFGLPDVPQVGPSSGPAAGSMAELLTGPHSARIYVDGPAKLRVQVMDRLAERDAVRHGNEVWLYNSKDNTATHLTLPGSESGTLDSGRRVPGNVATPEELAARMLEKVDASTDVAVRGDVEVAGRAAYNLVLTPRAQGTLVESVAVAVDGENGLPLSVEVRARGQQEPAFRTAFTSLQLGAPDAALFNFTPPPGATVKEQAVPPSGYAKRDPGEHSKGAAGAGKDEQGKLEKDRKMPAAAGKAPTVTGSGWETVVGFPARASAAGAGGPSAESLLNDPLLRQATVAVPGGRAISTSLLNVLLTDDGRMFVGSVPLERLQAAAAR
jgi:outer membrane lipoprotein-sorting protein